jgi:hypothetical protein
VGTVKFEARIKELVENLPDLAVLVEPLLVVRRQVQQAVEGRARTLLANLDELDEEPSEQIVENDAKGKVADAG